MSAAQLKGQLVYVFLPSTRHMTEPMRRKRFWLDIGRAFSLLGMVMIPIDSGFETFLQFYSPTGHELDIKPLKPISWEPAEPYRIIPRAVRYVAGRYEPHRVEAVFIEIQHTGEGRPCWETSDALEGHHAKPNHQPKGL